MKDYKVFAINPGSTSTKIAMFEGEKEIFSRNIGHDAEKLKEFKENKNAIYRKGNGPFYESAQCRSY